MKTEKPWHEDDTFWETWGPLMFTPERVVGSVDEVTGIIKLLDIKPGADILDLGCGIGRISLEFARRGFRVTGVDRTKSYIEQARKQAGKENLHVEFVHADMRTFVRPASFDCTVSMYTSFGYFEDPADDRRVVNNIYKSLKPGGVFLIETHGKETLARIFQERNWVEEDGVIWLQERKVSQNWSWMWNRWIMIKGKERIEGEVSHRLYAATEMKDLLTAGGFSSVDIYGNLAGRPYDHKAQRLITVGHE
jgi:SAM-dependent methyltransferase